MTTIKKILNYLNKYSLIILGWIFILVGFYKEDPVRGDLFFIIGILSFMVHALDIIQYKIDKLHKKLIDG